MPLRQVIEVMKTPFEKRFHCKIDLYSEKGGSIAIVHFEYGGQVDYSIHIFEIADEEKFEFLPGRFEIDARNLRAAATSLPRAVELLSILQLM